jgi:hypothetical protein
VDLAGAFAKIPLVLVHYPESFVGLLCLVVGIPKGVDPANAFLPFGFALLAFGLARRNFSHVGLWRNPAYKLRFTFKELFAAILWTLLTWGCFRWWALDVHLNEPIMRWLLRY